MMSSYYTDLRGRVGPRLLLVPSVAGLIHDSSGRLLLQRKGDGSWSLPAGAIEPGETPEAAMSRELREETGLTACALDLAGVFGGPTFRHTYPDGNQVEYVILVYRCTPEHLNVAPIDPETVELAFFCREDFPGLALPYPLELLFPPWSTRDVGIQNQNGSLEPQEAVAAMSPGEGRSILGEGSRP